MNLGTYDATIDFSKLFVHNSTSIYFKEGDLNTARVRAKLTMQGKSIDITGCNIVVKIETMTGQKINDVATIIDATNGIVEIDFKSNTLIEGTNFFELKIIKGESVKESPKLAYRVLDSIEDAGSIEGTNEYPILISLISDANKAIEDANEALELANTIKNNLEEVIDNANSAISNATDAINNANTAATNATSKITEVDNAKNDMTTKVDESIDTMKLEVNSAKNDMKITVDEAIKFLKQEFNSLTAQQQEELEMLQARDGEVNLNTRLERDLYIYGKSLKQEVLDLCGLKEVQEITYDSTTVPNYNGSMVCKETKNGNVKDLKVKGKSLVNIALDSSKVSLKANPNGWRSQNINHDLFQVGKNYVLKVFNISEVESPHMYLLRLHYTDNTVQTVLHGSELINGVREKEFTIQKEINYIQCATNLFIKDFSCDIVIVNSDDSKYVNDYFEGIASVGNGTDKIEVSSVKGDGNMFNPNSLSYGEVVAFASGTHYDSVYRKKDSPFNRIIGLPILLPKSSNLKIYFKCEVYVLAHAYYDKNLRLTRDNGWQENNFEIKPTSNDFYISSYIRRVDDATMSQSDIDFIKQNAILIAVNSFDSIVYEPYTECKKKVLYFDTTTNTWKPIPKLCGKWENGKQLWGDVVDSTKGKWYKRTLVHTFDSKFLSENIRIIADYGDVTRVDFTVDGIKTGGMFICDKYKAISIGTPDTAGVNIHSTQKNTVQLQIKTTDLTTKDVQGVISFLTKNPFEMVIELAQEKVYEVAPTELESYDNETMISFSAGPIAPYSSWKITSYLPNFVMNLSKRVKRIEDDFYKYTVVQNRMQLATTYSSDRTTFRVDTSVFTIEKAKQEVDYDLFRLLRHNILVGPQNYNKEEMESIMDFYVSIGKINYDMWDELYLLIEEQHNPPVEEETPIM